MAVESAGPTRTSFELKSAQLSVVAVALKSTDGAQLAAELERQRKDDQSFFDDDLVLIDLAAVAQDEQPIDFVPLLALLREHRTRPVAVRGGNPAQMQAALECGLVQAPLEVMRRAAPAAQEAVHEAEAVREVPVAAPPAMVIDKPVRSGQRIYARGDLVVLAIVSFGAEVIADGSIHVYAPLRGRAMAGARGDVNARIYTTCLEPQLVSIAGMYRTTENELPEDVRGKAAQVRLDGEKLIFDPL